MDPVLDRVRAADSVRPEDFAGRDDFDALVARLGPPRPARRSRRLLALPAAGAIVAAFALVPASTPQASEIIRRASAAFDPGAGILYAESSAQIKHIDGSVESFGSRRVWVHGKAMRWLEDSGAEEVSRPGPGPGSTLRYDPKTGKVTEDRGAQMIPGAIFRAREALRSAQAGGDVKLAGEETVDGRPAYVLRWRERSGPPHWPKLEQTLWVDRESYAPLRYRDHSSGLDASGKPLDETFTETVLAFERLRETPENLKLLELGPHPDPR